MTVTTISQPVDDDLKRGQAAVASLAQTITLLDKFHHENNNQFRRLHWWKYVEILRRKLKILQKVVEDAAKAAELARGGRQKKRPTFNESRIVFEAAFLRDQILMKAYMYRLTFPPVSQPRTNLDPRAFSQATTDRIHAPLGLFLIACVASAHSAIEAFFSRPNKGEIGPLSLLLGVETLALPKPPAAPGEGAALVVASLLSANRGTEKRTEPAARPLAGDDVGVRISRDQLQRTRGSIRAAPAVSSPTSYGKMKKKRKGSDDEFTSIFSGLN
jgi:hypothetical protein